MKSIKRLCYDAVVWENEYGKKHREDGPAVECYNGHTEWYINGKLHRVGGPAIIFSYGRKEWFVNGKRHRDDGPAIIHADWVKEWLINDRIVDLPTFEQYHIKRYWR